MPKPDLPPESERIGPPEPVEGPEKELADFNPATSHLHECAANENSNRPCDRDCIHYLFDVAVGLARVTGAIPPAPPEPADLRTFMEDNPLYPEQGPARA